MGARSPLGAIVDKLNKHILGNLACPIKVTKEEITNLVYAFCHHMELVGGANPPQPHLM
jgi:hypothetical protein